MVVALHSMLTERDRGTHVRIHCDNMAAVQALQYGRAHNAVLIECARAAWMTQAVLGVELSFVHVPGVDNDIADALSRAHLSASDHSRATVLIQNNSLAIVHPCLHVFHNTTSPMLSRSGNQIIAGQSRDKTGPGEGTRHNSKPEVDDENLHSVRQAGQVQPTGPRLLHGVRLHRIPGNIHPCPSNGAQQDITCQSVRQDGGGGVGRSYTPQGTQSSGGTRPQQTVCETRQASSAYGHTKVSYHTNPEYGRGGSSQGGCATHVLRGFTPVRGCPPIGQKV